MILVRGGEEKVGEDESHREEEQETATTPATTNDDIEILEEKVVYKNWRTIIQRNVRLRNGKIVNFDVRTIHTVHQYPQYQNQAHPVTVLHCTTR